MKSSAPTAAALGQLGEDWLASCRAGGKSPRTIDQYRFSITKVLLPFCVAQGIEEPAQLTRRVLDRLTSQLLSEGGSRGPLSRGTVACYLRPINVFISWLKVEADGGGIKAQVPTTPKRVRNTLSREEIAALEEAADLERDKLMVRVLADTGIRLGELLGLRANDLLRTDAGWSLKVYGKGAKERLVPLKPQVGRRLRKLADRNRQRSGSDHLWLTMRLSGKTGRHEPLSRRATQITLKSLAHLAGIDPPRVHPHAFRHSVTTELLRKGVNPIKVAELLGHRSLAMLMSNYSHVRSDDIRDDLERLLAD